MFMVASWEQCFVPTHHRHVVIGVLHLGDVAGTYRCVTTAQSVADVFTHFFMYYLLSDKAKPRMNCSCKSANTMIGGNSVRSAPAIT